MKHLIIIALLVTIIVIICPARTAQAQWPCPPVASPTATNLIQKDGYQAWLDFRPYWQRCEEGASIIGVDLGEGITALQFDNYIRYALYAYGVNGGVYQINVATNQIVTIAYPNEPPGDPGEAHGDNAILPSAPAAIEVVAPTETPVTQQRQAGLTIFQWIGRRVGW